jgi:predicted SAM-dependent methyltransferase
MDGWFRVDSNKAFEPDLVASVPPIPDAVRKAGPWEIIGLIHGIEHFYVWDAFELVKQCHSILEPNGQMILEQPNLEACMASFGSPESMLGIYGEQSYRDPALAHRYGYTPKTLTNMVLRAGFSRAVIEPAQFHRPERDFRLVAIA